MPTNWYELPWPTLLTLASGYVGYVVANLGLRSHHTAAEVTFGTLAYGFVGAFIYAYLRRLPDLDILTASATAFMSCAAAGALWGRFGKFGFEWILRRLGLTSNNDLQSAWQELFRTPGMQSIQLSVTVKGGKTYFCEDLARFEKCPHGPCVLGGAGDVLIYVTHVQRDQDSDFEPCSGIDDNQGGWEVTYIPQSEVARVDVRRRFKKNAPTSSEVPAG